MSEAKQYTSGIIEPLIATILSGQTKSNVIDTFGVTIVSMELPASFTGTEITYETSSDNVTFQPFYNILNIQVATLCTQGRNYGFAAQDFFTSRYVKLVSSSAEAADRIIRLVPQSI